MFHAMRQMQKHGMGAGAVSYTHLNNALVNYLWGLFYRMETAKEIRLYHMDALFEAKNDELMQDPAFRSFGKDNGKLLFQSDLLGQVLSFSAYMYVCLLYTSRCV